MSNNEPIRPADVSDPFKGSFEMTEHLYPVQPWEREVRSKMMYANLRGLSRLAFFWGGEDRTTLLAGLCRQVCTFDPSITIDASFVDRTEDQVGIYLLLRRRGDDPGENLRRLKELAKQLKRFASQPFRGKQIPVGRIVKMAVAGPDKPGVLCRVSEVIAGLGGNIKKLEADSADTALARGEEPDPRCLLMFTMELPGENPTLLEELRMGITGLESDIEVGFGAEAMQMRFHAFTRSRHRTVTSDRPDSDDPFTVRRSDDKTP
jgi:hypothetical protein